MNEKEWIRGQLLQLMDRASLDNLYCLLTIARSLIK
jgi:hypothetical protein